MIKDTLSANGMEITIWRKGSGLPLILFFGWNGVIEDYKDLVSALAEQGFAIYGVEFPGFGKSQAPSPNSRYDDLIYTAARLLDCYSIKQTVVMGHSLGCIAALRFAAYFPRRTKGLVIVNSPILKQRKKIGFVFDAGLFIFAIFLKPAAWAIRMLHAVAGNLPLHYLWRRLNRQYHFLTHHKGVMRRILRIIIEGDTRREAQEVHAPTLIIWSERGGITPLRNSRVLRKNIPRNKFVLLKGAGHHFSGRWAKNLASIVAGWALSSRPPNMPH